MNADEAGDANSDQNRGRYCLQPTQVHQTGTRCEIAVSYKEEESKVVDNPMLVCVPNDDSLD